MLEESQSLVTRAVNHALAVFRQSTHDNIVSYTAPGRIAPIAVIDSSIVHSPYTNDLMQSILVIYTCFWARAFAFRSSKVGLRAARTLDSLNPSSNLREGVTTASGRLGRLIAASESYNDGLPVFNDYDLVNQTIDADFDEAVSFRAEAREKREKRIAGTDQKSMELIAQSANLSVGKVIRVNFQEGEETLPVDVTIRLDSHAMRSESIVQMLSFTGTEYKILPRIRLTQDRQITVSDFFFSTDLINQEVDLLRSDKNGVFGRILRNKDRGFLTELISRFSANAPINLCSGIAVVNQRTLREVEPILGGPIVNLAARNKIFENSTLLMLVVVDTEEQEFDIWYRGVATPTTLTVNDIKQVSKGNGNDMDKVLTTLMQGRAPQF